MRRKVIPIVSSPQPGAQAGNTAAAKPGVILPPLALYVHFPWCVKKCPYCDFNSHEAKNDISEADYLAALMADLEAALPQVWGRRIGAVFIGGGTPSLLSGEAVDQLLAGIRSRVTLLPQAEITLEANPGTVETNRFAAFHAAGINRISLGIQSFDNAKLQALGRIHNADEARRAIDIARHIFDNLNLDLMYGLPEQTLAEAERDIQTAIAFVPAHISAYALTLEPNTLFHRSPPPLPDDDLAADMQEMIEERLAGAGYAHYETSAFARPGMHCRHNYNYWTFGDYLGIGAGAHAKITTQAGVVREVRHRHPRAYLDAMQSGQWLQDTHTIPAQEMAFEFLMNGLRLIEGFPIALFRERTGLDVDVIAEELKAAQDEGLLEMDANAIRPTLRGQRYLNQLLHLFLPE